MATIDGLGQVANEALGGASNAKGNPEIIDQTEFLELLVTQLQNQDPLNPMQNEEFAVQLAQFTQVEQLIGINEKLESGKSGESFGSLASYLGQEVWLDSDVVSVADGNAGEIAFQLGSGASNVDVELVDSAGVVRQVLNIGALSSGSHRISLDGINVANGDYQARVKATSASGSEVAPEVSVAGIVNGYIPGPNPTLLVGDREVLTSEISRVQIPA